MINQCAISRGILDIHFQLFILGVVVAIVVQTVDTTVSITNGGMDVVVHTLMGGMDGFGDGNVGFGGTA